jgi:hypothetical protein
MLHEEFNTDQRIDWLIDIFFTSSEPYFRYIHDKNKCKYNKSLGNQVSPRWTYGRVFWLPQDKRAHFTLHRATNHF